MQARRNNDQIKELVDTLTQIFEKNVDQNVTLGQKDDAIRFVATELLKLNFNPKDLLEEKNEALVSLALLGRVNGAAKEPLQDLLKFTMRDEAELRNDPKFQIALDTCVTAIKNSASPEDQKAIDNSLDKITTSLLNNKLPTPSPKKGASKTNSNVLDDLIDDDLLNLTGHDRKGRSGPRGTVTNTMGMTEDEVPEEEEGTYSVLFESQGKTGAEAAVSGENQTDENQSKFNPSPFSGAKGFKPSHK